MLGQGGYGVMDKVNRIRMPGRPGIKNLLNDMVLTYYNNYDIIYRNERGCQICSRR